MCMLRKNNSLPSSILCVRKGQAKKVICIPAPAADQEGNIKTSGVVVPSDLWAWRKYGQKPIKGSPYPRGYYRCSSSKGCLARKQVERSRTDPNMLDITYTSEHNHPLPTHRNSLAGSSRSTNTTHSKSSENPTSTCPTKNEAIKEENVDFEHVFDNSYEPLMLDYSNDMEFFDELGGLEPNPMSFFFNKLEEEGVDNKDNVDVLSYFDWSGD